MDARGVGNSDLFDTGGFSLATLRKIPGLHPQTLAPDSMRRVCRLPCPNCEKVLTLFGIPATREGQPPRSPYDLDMDEADVEPW